MAQQVNSSVRPPQALFPAGYVVNASLKSFEELEALAAKWRLTTYQLERGTYRALLQGIHTPLLQLGRTWRALSSYIDAQIPEHTVMLCFPACSGVRRSFRGRNLGAREVVLQQEDCAVEFSLSGESDIITLAVSREELERRAQHLWHHSFPTHTGTLSFSSQPHANQAATFSLETIADHLFSGGRLADPDYARHLENRLLDGILCSLEDRSHAAGLLGRHSLARRASGILRERCAEDISITDLCQATGATRRTLHLGFFELYGMSPMAYLKALRLCRVRRDLARAHDAGMSVTDVATRWGFCHLGRFASDYRSFFGELPSTHRDHLQEFPAQYRSFL